MAVVKLNARNVLTLPAGEGRTDYADLILPGLVLRVSPTGARTFAFRYGRNGTRRVTLGDARSMALSTARRKAKAIVGAVARGHDPAAEKAAARKKLREKTDTFRGLAERLIAEADLAQNTRASWGYILRKWINPKIGDRDPATVVRADITELAYAAKKTAPQQANHVLKIVAWVYARAVDRGLLSASPASGLRRVTKERQRDRVGTDAELRTVWAASDGWAGSGAAVKLALLTGARRGEVFGARWDEIDVDARVWRIPAARSKNTLAHEVPLSDAALALICGLPSAEAPEDDPEAVRWLFRGEDGKALRGRFAFAQKCRRAGITGLRFHDLRRSVRDRLTRDLEVPFVIAEGVIGHAPSTLTRTYNPSGVSFREMANALQRWANELARIVSGKTTEKVVRMVR